MKILKNDVDYEIEYTDVYKAKRDMCTIQNFCNGEYIGEDYNLYKKQCNKYQREILNVYTLEELADVLNKYTDTFGNGSQWFVKEI